MKTEIYESMILELDQKHSESLANQEPVTGTHLEVHNAVAQRMVDQNNYQIERQKLVELKNDSRPLSKGVQDFLNPQRVVSKFDVDLGAVKIDNSLQPLGGKIL